MIPFATHIATAAVAGVLAFGAGWQVQSWRYGGQIADIKAAQALAMAMANEEASRNFRAITTKYEGALNAARTRETVLRRNADLARTESDGLRAQLTDAARRIADAPTSAVAEYATAVGRLFADCSRDYQGMAAKASGHAADVRTHREAWPVMGGQ